MKRVLTLPVRNEDWMLAKTLAAASLWADHIIVADQHSTDHTREILAQFPKVVVIENKAEYHNSAVRGVLLLEARKITGLKVIFSFDADEIPTADILEESFWREIEALAPGTAIELLWVNLWRSTHVYRTDGVQKPSWKEFGFIDDGTAQYTTLNVINDHTSRLPGGLKVATRFYEPKVLHYQFVDFSRMLSKQAHYRATEWLQKRRNFINALKINLKYFATKDERGLRTSQVPEQWMAGYARHGINVGEVLRAKTSWHDTEVLDYFKKYGAKFFFALDMWDIDWRAKAVVLGRLDAVPVPWLRSWLWRRLLALLAYRNLLTRLYARLHK